MRHHEYADGAQSYITLNEPLIVPVSALAQCLTAIVKQLRENQLKMNPDKTEMKLVVRPDALNYYYYYSP